MDFHPRSAPVPSAASRAQGSLSQGHDSPPAAPQSPAAARLALHMDIAWDFDGTLVDHPASPLLHQFIRAHRGIRHVIITFRTHGMESLVWSELARHRAAPPRSCFDGVLNVPDEMWERVSDRRKRLGLVRHLVPPFAAELQYRRWKGWACQKHAITALVDDMPAMVASGCRRYGIALFHPKDFLAP
jgi:hypothetical protein